MKKQYDVVAAGNYSLDLIFTGLPGLPELGREVVGTGFEMLPGEAYNSVVTMHRLGVRVGWAADFGSDDFSRFALDRASQEGLDVSLFVHHPRPLRRVSVAASFPHDRAFITYYDPDPPIPAAVKALASVSARVFFLPGLFYGGLFEAGKLLVAAKKMKLVMDGNSGNEATLDDPAVRRAVASVDVLLPNADETRRMTGYSDLTKAIRELGKLCRLVIVKDGPHGSHACLNGETIHVPAYPVEPLDTTGAGDAFNAGFLKAWLDDQPLETCLRWGNLVGALSTQGHGGTGRTITSQEVEEKLASMPLHSS